MANSDQERKQRLAEALRANLRRRKAQSREVNEQQRRESDRQDS